MNELQKRSFISKVAEYILKYAPLYGIKYVSPIIAQACLESAWGQSKLSSAYHNYFGMKCGRGWKGASVNMKTKEEYSPGTLTTITGNFRAYSSLEEGIKGYFEFIQAKRYSNLKDAVSAEDYCEKLKLDGWATSSTYIQNLIKVINDNCLKNYDEFVKTALNGGKIETSTHIISGEVKTYKPVTDELVKAVINGKYGNGIVRKQKLEAEGYSYSEVQHAVNKGTISSKAVTHKPVSDDVVNAVLKGKYGNGAERQRRLEAEGYNYAEVRSAVNKRLSGR